MSEPTPDKITVSYDDLNTRRVEQRLKEQDALARNRVYAAMDESAVTPAADRAPGGLAGLWRNGTFVLAFFGLVGGLLAWGCGTLLEFNVDLRADSAERLRDIARIVQVTENGQLTFDEGRHAVDAAIAAGREENPHFALAVVRPDAEFRQRALDRLTVRRSTKAVPDAEAKADIDATLAAGRRDNEDFAVMTDPALPDAAKLQRLADQAARRDKQGEEVLAAAGTKALVGNVLAYGVRGVILGLLLAIALPVSESNAQATIINGSVGAALGLAGGVAAAFVTDRIRAVGAAYVAESWQRYVATVATWAALGVFLTLAPGLVLRSGKKLVIGLAGGLIGGLIGGVLYEPVQSLPAIARIYPHARIPELVAMVAIGLMAGLATGLIENAAKTGWVKVVQGLIAGKQFILYRNPTFIGSGPDCQIYLFKDPKVGKRHAAVHIIPGGFELEDLPLGTETLLNGKPIKRARVRNGDRIQVGSTQLVFMEKEQAG